MQKPDPMAHGPLQAHSSSIHVDEHLRAISDHLGAILWEHALAIVRAAESGEPLAAAEARASARRTMDALADRVADETGQLVTGLGGLRRRTTGDKDPASTGSPPDPQPEAGDQQDPDGSQGGPRHRASLHDSPLSDLFQRTD